MVVLFLVVLACEELVVLERGFVAGEEGLVQGFQVGADLGCELCLVLLLSLRAVTLLNQLTNNADKLSLFTYPQIILPKPPYNLSHHLPPQ